jgi:hypothetical protein
MRGVYSDAKMQRLSRMSHDALLRDIVRRDECANEGRGSTWNR